ncbi:M20 family peptidase [Sinirhodobacter populi]|uniref:M20 family peptidase n=1 Tax=Paenirhodobacter populi TaxID=2306993 RepID=A0A443K3L3_9RHOB|nr:Sapep family Mn(2+)-dependent dipeptidase [Sinirhodobacter populi]RWR27356.1 M20 family peptidase [Sinirhodobacter populi]
MADNLAASYVPKELTAAEQDLFTRAGIWFEDHRAEFVADLLAWVAVPSVSEASQAQPGKPFGPEVARIFDLVTARARELGFRTETHDGYAISVLWGDASEEIGLVSHLDVVPAGENWTFEPYAPFERDGFVVGRGASDNKGPALVDLYLLRALRDLGLRPRRTIRIVYGGAEETGMEDMEHYARHYPIPEVSIISDGGFPVNYAQKGGLNLSLHVPAGPVLSGFRAGVAENAVPATAAIRLPQAYETVRQALAQLPADLAAVLTVAEADGATVLTARGQSGHAAFPENTRNAIPLLLRALIGAGLVEGRDLQAAQVVAGILADPWGEGAGTAREDETTGRLTQNGGIVVPADDGFDLSIDIRYPISADAAELVEVLTQALRPVGGSVRVTRHAAPMHIDRDSDLVRLLQDTFDTLAQTKTEPFAMGGGTHARVFPKSVTFGPGFGRNPDLSFRGESVTVHPAFVPEVHGAAHGPDEFVSLENLKRALGVYAVTLPRLDDWLDRGSRSHA